MKITLFGLAGTGTSTVGKMLSKNLDYEFTSSGNMFRKWAEENGMTMEEADVFLKEKPDTHLEIDSQIKTYGEENDNFVIDSRLAWFFIKDSVKIKLACDDEARFKRIADSKGSGRIAYKNEDLEATKIKTLKRQFDHQETITKLYGVEDMNEDRHFDLVIDTTCISPAKVLSRILEYIECLEKNGKECN